jgi:D-amino peptidase
LAGAGELGVPLLFVSSDDKACAEARSFMPWVKTVTTKIGYGRTCAQSKHPAVVEEEIYKSVQLAVAGNKTMECFRFEKPIWIEIVFKSWLFSFKARARRKGWEFSGSRSISAKLDSMLDWRC